jgi:hypothetical protein
MNNELSLPYLSSRTLPYIVQISNQEKIAYSFYINFTDRMFYPVEKIYQFSFKIVIYMSLYSIRSTL